MKKEDNTEKGYKAVALGYSALDYLGVVPYFPRVNRKMRLRKFDIQGGGPAATAAVTASRLGLKTSFIGIVGDDSFGRMILEEMRRERVDISSVIIVKGKESQFAFIMVDEVTGDRTILWTRGSLPFIKEEQVDTDLILSADILLIDSLEPQAAAYAAEIAGKKGIPVVIDAGTLRDGVTELLPLCDYIIASEVFADQISRGGSVEEALDILHSYGPEASVVTLGENGCIALDADGLISVEGFNVDVVDTTGAGDVFHGAFLFALMQGWDLYRMCVFSNAVAALKCRKLGGRAGICDIEKTIEYLSETKPGLKFEISE
ncbi:MAG TPA: PfkB family carbohydrate kinase [Candidatus Krumholzibacteriaceae bacterium]|nr:PfkB family carbohydrate kinase [Candidatus Krumholzibacteriaceae bacterium]